MAQFTFNKKQNKYFITNEEIDPITYKITRLSDCVDYNTETEGEIESGETFEFSLHKDGEYQVIINGVDIITIKHYLKLQNSIIEDIKNYVCDCQCGCECSDDTELCDLLTLRTKFDVYKRLTNPHAVSFYDAVYAHTKCLVSKTLYCSVNTEIITGEVDCNLKLAKQLIILDYLAMYFYEVAFNVDESDELYLYNQFKVRTIFCCAEALGINIKEIKKLINNSMGTFNITSSAYINLPPSQIGDYSLNVLNRSTTVLSIDMFTTDTTPIYIDPEGDGPKEVRIDTLPLVGLLQLNGITVTVGQIITVADINAGYLIYVSPDEDGVSNMTFEFSVSDLGSGLFSS